MTAQAPVNNANLREIRSISWESATSLPDFRLNVAQMMGRDYIFFSSPQMPLEELCQRQNLEWAMRALKRLRLTPDRTVIIAYTSRDEAEIEFTRCDIHWSNDNPEKISPQLITKTEQIDFFETILFNSAAINAFLL